MKRVLCKVDSRLADQRASSFLSNTVGNEMKWNVDFGNCDKMITVQFKQWQDACN